MGYGRQTFQIPGGRGGFTAEENVGNIPPEMMVRAENINLNKNARATRGGTSHVNATVISGTPKITGLFDFRLKNGNQFLVTTTADGKIYKNFTQTIKTGLALDGFYDFETWNESLYMANQFNVPQVWDGITSGTSDIENMPTDWTANTSYPKYFVKHGRGNSERMWAFGVPEFPFTIYASDDNDGINEPDFSDANVKLFNIQTNDGIGIVGGIEFGDRLIVFGRRRAYIIDDTDLNTDNWGYQQVQWEGGVAHHRLIVKTPNDVICMMDDGTIYSITAVESYGDYKQASISKPAFVDDYIRNNLDLSKIEQFHAAYDPVLRAIKWFVVRQGQNTPDTALVYFIDRGPQEGWVIHNNTANDSGYSANCSALVKDVANNFKIYTGDYGGFVWELETRNKNDNGNAFFAGFKTAELDLGNPRITKKIRRIWIILREIGNYNLNVDVGITQNNAKRVISKTVSMLGDGGVYGIGKYGTAKYGGGAMLRKAIDIGGIAESIDIEISNSNVGQKFFVTQMMIDFMTTGNRPQ